MCWTVCAAVAIQWELISEPIAASGSNEKAANGRDVQARQRERRPVRKLLGKPRLEPRKHTARRSANASKRHTQQRQNWNRTGAACAARSNKYTRQSAVVFIRQRVVSAKKSQKEARTRREEKKERKSSSFERSKACAFLLALIFGCL